MLISQLKEKSVLVVAAHPDDETLGCGGTIARFQELGAKITLVTLTNGVSARGTDKGALERKDALANAAKTLGIENVIRYDFPDNALDSLPNLEITQSIEKVAEKFKPEIVLTHFCNDLNVDHRIAFMATITAFRPLPSCPVKLVLQYETVSSSEWNFQDQVGFRPNFFVDISQTLDKKVAALQCYEEEMRDFPHARSIENVKNLSYLRGATSGVSAAEAFIVARGLL